MSMRELAILLAMIGVIVLGGCQTRTETVNVYHNGGKVAVYTGQGTQERGRQGVPVTNSGGIVGGTGGEGNRVTGPEG